MTMKILRDQIGQRVYNIHRIDRPTTGVLLFSVDRTAARALHRALERHQVAKNLLGNLPAAWLPKNHGNVTQPMQKEEDAPMRDAHTSFRRLAVSHSSRTGREDPARFHSLRPPHTPAATTRSRRHLLQQACPSSAISATLELTLHTTLASFSALALACF